MQDNQALQNALSRFDFTAQEEKKTHDNDSVHVERQRQEKKAKAKAKAMATGDGGRRIATRGESRGTTCTGTTRTSGTTGTSKRTDSSNKEWGQLDDRAV